MAGDLPIVPQTPVYKLSIDPISELFFRIVHQFVGEKPCLNPILYPLDARP
jgi:hypothetical protein